MDRYTGTTEHCGCYVQRILEGCPGYLELIHLFIFHKNVNLPFNYLLPIKDGVHISRHHVFGAKICGPSKFVCRFVLNHFFYAIMHCMAFELWPTSLEGPIRGETVIDRGRKLKNCRRLIPVRKQRFNSDC